MAARHHDLSRLEEEKNRAEPYNQTDRAVAQNFRGSDAFNSPRPFAAFEPEQNAQEAMATSEAEVNTPMNPGDQVSKI